MTRTEPHVTQGYPEPARAISHEQVALRAYTKWLERGCPSGDSDADWYQALSELQIEGQNVRPAAKPDAKPDQKTVAKQAQDIDTDDILTAAHAHTFSPEIGGSRGPRRAGNV